MLEDRFMKIDIRSIDVAISPGLNSWYVKGY